MARSVEPSLEHFKYIDGYMRGCALGLVPADGALRMELAGFVRACLPRVLDTWVRVIGAAFAIQESQWPEVHEWMHDAALRWIRERYTVDENPGMGQRTVYYYYMVLAKAFAAVGESTLVDRKGQPHVWREELARKLISLQDKEGFWVNPVKDEWQDNRVLVTSFVLSAIEAILR